jgi:hypothetical protein
MHQSGAALWIEPHAFAIGATMTQSRDQRGNVISHAWAKPTSNATHKMN